MRRLKVPIFVEAWREALPKWAFTMVSLVLIVLVAVLLGALAWGFVLHMAGTSQPPPTKAFSGPSWSYIAKIKVVGAIGSNASVFLSSDQAYHHLWTLQTIDTLIGDEKNKGIYLWLDTPGGGVYESDELYLKLMEYKEKTGRPIYTYMTKMAASGGYYIAASSDEIYANRNTWTGSIGVTLGTLFDISGLLDKYGIKTETITSGDNKAMGNYYEPLTEEQRAIYQSLVDDSFERFVAIVATGRGMTDAEARKVSDGRIFTASQALDAGLIDAIMGEKEAEEFIKEKFDGGADFYLCFFRPDTQFALFNPSGFNIWDLLRGLIFSSGVTDGTGFGSGSGSDSFGSGPDSSGRGFESSGDVAAVLDLVRELEARGLPLPQYLYTG